MKLLVTEKQLKYIISETTKKMTDKRYQSRHSAAVVRKNRKEKEPLEETKSVRYDMKHSAYHRRKYLTTATETTISDIPWYFPNVYPGGSPLYWYGYDTSSTNDYNVLNISNLGWTSSYTISTQGTTTIGYPLHNI